MNNLDEIINKIQQFAPESLAEEWDNTGWQIFLGNKSISKLMIALSPSIDVIEQAVSNNCELLITHHPLIFDKISNLCIKNFSNQPVINAIKNNLQIYSAHTNFDSAEGGMADILANMLGLSEISSLATTESTGIGRKGCLLYEEELDLIIEKIKKQLDIETIKLINPAEIRKVRNIAVLPGSGGGLIPYLNNIDLYITGDVKYHDALSAEKFAVIDAGHFETEIIALEYLKNLIENCGSEIFIAKEKHPWVYV